MPRKEILQDAIAYSDEENLIQLLMAKESFVKSASDPMILGMISSEQPLSHK